MKEHIIIDHEAAALARKGLLEWHDGASRSFPWRHTSDPYHVLIAEMMLRRTQARQVVAVYNRFIDRYPDAVSLDRASTDEVTEILHPLGLSWRAANFKILAHEIVTLYRGKVPRDRQSLVPLA